MSPEGSRSPSSHAGESTGLNDAVATALDKLSVDHDSDTPSNRSHSTTPNSTSTYVYSHEPFETVKDKMAALSTDLKASAVDEIQRLKGGSFNRVISARVSWPTEGSPTHLVKPVIFRIPRLSQTDGPNEDIQTQAAVLQFVRQHGILAPEVLAFDATSSNAIQDPYTVQVFAQGTKLDLAYEHMPL